MAQAVAVGGGSPRLVTASARSCARFTTPRRTAGAERLLRPVGAYFFVILTLAGTVSPGDDGGGNCCLLTCSPKQSVSADSGWPRSARPLDARVGAGVILGLVIEIPVELGPRRYAISVGHGLAKLLPDVLRGFRGRRMVVVASRRVFALHGRGVERSLRSLGPVAVTLLPDGERFKSRSSLEAVYDALLEARLGRDGLVVALGGGVVGDVAGFAAATWARGVDWVGIPTTLLSMVDSSIGGKVGINHAQAKNMIGAFHQPRAVVVDPAFLDTLPPRELRSGGFEILKCAILSDRTLFASMRAAPAGLRGWDRMQMENAIATACRIKADVVEKDEREAGLRRVLNLGHTIGHALETVTRYRRFAHGEAVGWGLVGASFIARRRGVLSEKAYQAIASAVDHVGPRPPISDLRPPGVLEALARDKKARGGRVPFILPAAVGRVEIHDDVSRAEIAGALRAMARREALSPP